MSKPQSEAPIKFASAQVVKALFVQSVKTKEETSTIAGKFGERIKTQVENGNLHNAAFGQAAAIFRKAKNNELKAKEHLAHLRFYLELIEEEMYQKGHTGNLVDQANSEEPETAASVAAKAFAAEDAETDANRSAAREALDLPADGSAAAPPPPADAVEKPKRGRKPKLAAASADDAAPPPPPAPTLKDDDDDEDIRPGFLKAKEAERKAAAVH